jgi:hypothetical protein
MGAAGSGGRSELRIGTLGALGRLGGSVALGTHALAVLSRALVVALVALVETVCVLADRDSIVSDGDRPRRSVDGQRCAGYLPAHGASLGHS